MDQPHLADREWFRHHQNANYRLREPAPGEVNTLARRMDSNVQFLGTDLSEAPAGSSWRVAVVKTDPKTLIKLLVLRRDGDPDERDGFFLNLLAMGNRVAIDRV